MTRNAGIVLTKVGYRALELTSRTRFFDLQILLGMKEVYEQDQKDEGEQEGERDSFVGFHVP